MPLRRSLAGALGALALAGSVAGAQQTFQPPVVNQGPHYPQPVLENTSNGAGTGPYAVTLTNGDGSTVYLGTASSVTFSTVSGVSSTPLAGTGGTAVVYFAANNSLLQRVAPATCFVPQQQACPQLASVTIQLFGGPTLTTMLLYIVKPVYAFYGVGVFAYQVVQSTTVPNVVVR